jgi:hypothetical protein
MTCEAGLSVTGGIPQVIYIRETGQQHFGTRRFKFVVGWLAAFIALSLVSITVPYGSMKIEALAEMLCCDGCCRTSLTSSKTAFEEPPSATILHLSGSTEIDYTSNGHRVPLHMETALSELDHIERHVKLGLPKYLQESAAQREADLVDHKFVRDLEGTDSSRHSKHPSSEHSSREQDADSESDDSTPAVLPKSKPTLTQAVAEAALMERHLRLKDEEEEGRIIAPTSRELSRDNHEAEKEAANIGKSSA